MAASRKILIILALVVLTCVLYFFLVYKGKQDEIDKTQEHLNDLNKQLSEVRSAAQGLDAIKMEITKLDQQLTESLSQLPEEKKIESILRSFEDLASSAGLDIASVKPGAEVARDFYAEIPIDLEINGAYHNIALFFDKVSKQKRVVNISNLKLSDPRVTIDGTMIRATCVATAFRFRRSEEAAPAPAAGKQKKPAATSAPEQE